MWKVQLLARYPHSRDWLICHVVKLEYMERFGEGSIFRQGYLDGGKKMD
jgi:hypothetical protein